MSLRIAIVVAVIATSISATADAQITRYVDIANLPSPGTRTESDSFSMPETMPSPLRRLGSHANTNEYVTRLGFDAAAYEILKTKQSVTLSGFCLAPSTPGAQEVTATLRLRRVRIFGDQTKFVVGGEGSNTELGIPDVAIFSGSVIEYPGSFVYLSFSPHGTHGYLRLNGSTQVVSPGPPGDGRDLLIYNLDTLPPGMIHWRDFLCHTESAKPHNPRRTERAGDPMPLCYRLLIAIETDFEFSDNLFGGDLEAASAYIATLIGASSEILVADADVSFELGFVRLWDAPDDPWTGSTTQAQLNQFSATWNGTMQDVERDLAHFLSGRSLGGGIAFLGVVCSSGGYALSANLSGFFPYPLLDNHEQNWDIMVVTHEFGHNLDAIHTHDFCPPIDQCAPNQFHGSCQDTTICTNASTLMSYCHLCEGGMTNILLQFHPLNVERVHGHLDGLAACELTCDCNGNGIPDDIDLADGTSDDCNDNSLPDECEPDNDCNSNGIQDICDIANDTSEDCVLIHDCCEVERGPGCSDPQIEACVCAWDAFCCTTDWDSVCVGQVEDRGCGSCTQSGNGVPDECDIADGTSQDCNDNGVPDGCDIADGTSQDCNVNGVPDGCDIADGTSDDNDADGIPDECDCPSDVDGDGNVGASDLANLLGSWGPCPDCPADLDGDGDVDAVDLAHLLGSWGACLP